MSTDQRTDHGQFADAHRSNVTVSPNAAIGMTAAGVAMIVIGLFHAIQGFSALFSDSIFAVGRGWIVHLDVATWGWIHLVGAVIVAATGALLFTGSVWARAIGVAVLAVSALLNVFWMPYYPVLSVVTIALDGYLIWALTVHRDVIPIDENSDWD
jgi:hypothetical protein